MSNEKWHRVNHIPECSSWIHSFCSYFAYENFNLPCTAAGSKFGWNFCGHEKMYCCSQPTLRLGLKAVSQPNRVRSGNKSPAKETHQCDPLRLGSCYFARAGETHEQFYSTDLQVNCEAVSIMLLFFINCPCCDFNLRVNSCEINACSSCIVAAIST